MYFLTCALKNAPEQVEQGKLNQTSQTFDGNSAFFIHINMSLSQY